MNRPEWIKVRAPLPHEAAEIRAVRGILASHRLTSVCQGAICPNAVECWSARTATFMILGDVCTRACRFCAVPTGDPNGHLDLDEPRRVASAVRELGLRYVVLTSVDRDDLADGGSSVFAEAIRRIKELDGEIRVEALIPDFGGNDEALAAIASAGADVIAHNLETVERITPLVRDRRAGYRESLSVLTRLKGLAPGAVTKSSLILGLGEEPGEILDALRDLRGAGVNIVALGQYLRPTKGSYPVRRYIPPAEFAKLRDEALELGFSYAVAGPLVRSSYRAAEAYAAAVSR